MHFGMYFILPSTNHREINSGKYREYVYMGRVYMYAKSLYIRTRRIYTVLIRDDRINGGRDGGGGNGVYHVLID